MPDSLDKLVYSFVMEDVLKGFFIRVPPGYVACVYDLGQGVLRRVYMPGLHLKIPFWQQARLFNTQTLEYSISNDFTPSHEYSLGDEPVRAQTADGRPLVIEGTVLLRLDVDQIPIIWQQIGEDFVAKIVRPTIRSRMRMIASRYGRDDIMSLKREVVETDAKTELARIFYPRGIIVENVLLSEVREE
ncbi:hypothetical protein HY628_00055 [Candidatus Uhrbacteria bacterium]|nr:hypothetical protein [Candidatus Uhrbacteria bacterium]